MRRFFFGFKSPEHPWGLKGTGTGYGCLASETGYRHHSNNHRAHTAITNMQWSGRQLPSFFPTLRKDTPGPAVLKIPSRLLDLRGFVVTQSREQTTVLTGELKNLVLPRFCRPAHKGGILFTVTREVEIAVIRSS